VFTGLIQALGKIKSLGGDSWQITCVSPDSDSLILTDLALGDSVAVDGVCLTVESVLDHGFIATASPETLRRTTLGKNLSADNFVNLETSLRVGGKVGGHFVMGHVDGVGRLQNATPTATSWEISFTINEAIARYLVPKGSIAINGISLTIAETDALSLKVSVIPVTYESTNLRYLTPGSWVNLEGDILGKYVEKLIHSPAQSSLPSAASSDYLSPTFLAENGYL
jgi:riboflavin synthase